MDNSHKNPRLPKEPWEFGSHKNNHYEASLRPQNRRALALIEEWLSEPDDLGEEWWDSFEQDLKKYRLSFREA